MITIRKSSDRGHFDHGWLDTYHSFSFGDYRDPEQMGFRTLRVINEDFVAPGAGFPTHPHRDMEILTWVLDGALAHKDSTGGVGAIRPGDLQRMTAGHGVMHSEFNHSKTEPVHLLQIWIRPEAMGLTPGYEQKMFAPEATNGDASGGGGAMIPLRLLASHDARDGSLTIHQDANLYLARLAPGQRSELHVSPARGVWVQVSRGSISVNGKTLKQGDAAAVTDEGTVTIEAKEDAEALVFDLA